MKTGLFFLLLGYVLSQFYRAFLAVLAPALLTDLGVGADDLARASGYWFLAFALMQIPVGWALDRMGPRLTASVLLAIGGGGGALLFALAQSALAIDIAMVLIGIGCAPVLMASYYIFARAYPPAVFGMLAGIIVGVGSLGNIASALPLAWSADFFGWRETVFALAAITFAVAIAAGRFVPDLPAVTAEGAPRGSLLDLLRMPALWFILPMLLVAYAPSAGIRGLWIGPYFADVHGAGGAGVGQATLVMGFAMVAGSILYGPLDRLFRSRKWVVFGGNALGLVCLVALALWPQAGFWNAALLLAAVGFFGASFPTIMAHGRSFVPPHLTGRGVTLLNLFSIGGVGLLQMLSGRIHATALASGAGPAEAYQMLFWFFAAAQIVGLAVYLFSKDRLD
ncbi:MFS transporter [Plastorhodobacter daqingensis]|uniref:MFS transporter n=1 Tax=Plastorhodobacter daqingensis TaxID=1387281 RepID=A0ABW2UHK3_9RHOB